MRLKYLSLCLLGLSISGCSQHVIKSNTHNNLALSEQATQGLNALFENSSYDLKGQFSIQTDLKFEQEEKQQKKQEKPIGPVLDPQLKKQIDQLIRTQNIPFSQKEKKVLYQALAKKNDVSEDDYDDRYEGSSPKTQIAQSLVNVLNDLQFSYNGSVHFRQKLAALTLQLNYQKPTLQIQAQLPMVVDFNEHKFYTNYFAIMPFMVNRDSQGRLAYIDFSKHKEAFEQVDLKKFAEYLKQMNALTYTLADANQVHTLGLTQDEKAQGALKKIRFSGDLDTVHTQLELYDYVNEIYYTEQVKGEQYSEDSQSVEDETASEAVEAATEAADAAAMAAQAAYESSTDADEEGKAYASSERVYQLINEKMHSLMYHEHDHGAEDEESSENESDQTAYDATAETATEAAANAVDAAADATGSVSSEHHHDEAVDATAVSLEDLEETDGSEHNEEESRTLSEEICEALVRTKNVPIGKVTLCMDYQDVRVIPSRDDIQESDDAIADAEEASSEDASVTALEQLKPLFKPYQSQQLIDAQQFKQLWQKHESEIKKVLAEHQTATTSVVIDLTLDSKGRVQNIDYDMAFNESDFGKLNFKSTNQIFNYGNATAIDRQALKQAQSIEEVSKGSLLENAIKGVLAPITGESHSVAAQDAVDAAAAATIEASETEAEIELPDYLSTVALQSYKRHHSELKAYQAAFVVAFAGYRAEYLKYYSAKALDEISEIYAYQFVEDLEQPKGQALKRLNQLREKHALKSGHDFDGLGSTVNEYVQDGIADYKKQLEWNELKKKYRTEQAIFAQLYLQKYIDIYDVTESDKASLTQASQVYAKAYMDDRKGQLSEASVSGLKAEYEDLFSQSVYLEAYKYIDNYTK